MHQSRLGAVVIDCKTDDLDTAASFWASALGCAPKRSDDPDNVNYVKLESRAGEVQLLVQKVDHPSRVHIDIETNDIEAEVKRLEKLGAKRIGMVKRWCVMEAPSGQRFCVVSPQRSNFESEANVWR